MSEISLDDVDQLKSSSQYEDMLQEVFNLILSKNGRVTVWLLEIVKHHLELLIGASYIENKHVDVGMPYIRNASKSSFSMTKIKALLLIAGENDRVHNYHDSAEYYQKAMDAVSDILESKAVVDDTNENDLYETKHAIMKKLIYAHVYGGDYDRAEELLKDWRPVNQEDVGRLRQVADKYRRFLEWANSQNSQLEVIDEETEL